VIIYCLFSGVSFLSGGFLLIRGRVFLHGGSLSGFWCGAPVLIINKWCKVDVVEFQDVNLDGDRKRKASEGGFTNQCKKQTGGISHAMQSILEDPVHFQQLFHQASLEG
jgi:hypothetical protein